MKLPLSATLIAAVLLTACQSQPGIQEMRNENRQLADDLEAARTEIDLLNQQERELRDDIAELNRVNDVLGTEKSSRVQESSKLRGQVRHFVQRQIDAYKDFLVQGGLLDYVGGELVERAHTENEPRLLVDLANPIPDSGTLTGVGAYFATAGSFDVKVLRPVEDKLVVIWDSQRLEVTKPGRNRIKFPVSVVVEKGDIIAYYFGEGVPVSFDKGTGDTRYQNGPVKLGATLSPSSLEGEQDRRAYSLGVYGLLNRD